MVELRGRFGSQRRSTDCGFLFLLPFVFLATGLVLNGCGGSSGGGETGSLPDDIGGDDGQPAPPADNGGDTGDGGGSGDEGGSKRLTSLSGNGSDTAAGVITDYFADTAPEPDEYSEDTRGLRIQRTVIKLIFLDDATVDEVNALLAELSAEIVASLEGYPALVVRIPDPGTLQDLDTLVADIKSRGFVHSVLRSIEIEKDRLPNNVSKLIFSHNPPLQSPNWKLIRHHLAVRAGAAWQLQDLSGFAPPVIVVDGFGDGEPVASAFNIMSPPGVAFGFGVDDHDDHGYGVLGTIAGSHLAGSSNDLDFVTGMVPGTIELEVVDLQTASSLAIEARVRQRLKAALNRSAKKTVVVNQSFGWTCSNRVDVTQPCHTTEELNKHVVNFIKELKHIGGDKRALFVSSAGNRKFDNAGNYVGPNDAPSRSFANAATLMDEWRDPVSGARVPPLDNILVVENAHRGGDNAPEFKLECTDAGSYVGGHVSANGVDVYRAIGPGTGGAQNSGLATCLSVKDSDPATCNARQNSDFGTSGAAPQVAGVAAYLISIDDDLTPQQLKNLIVSTATPLVASGTDCAESSAPGLDAYAAILATDADLTTSDAIARLHLLDVTDNTLEESTPQNSTADGVFNYLDLVFWINKLTIEQLADEKNYFGRYDLNGDGTTGGPGIAPFDLDLSAGPDSKIAPYTTVFQKFLGRDTAFFEDGVTDIQIICYYANSDLYETIDDLSPFTLDDRDKELEKIATLCDPCAAVLQPVSLNSSGQILSAPANAAEQCVEPLVTITPASASVDPEKTVQFTATVTGLSDTDVIWSASGGSITPAGLYTAGSTEGDFTVTATSVEDAGISGTAQVQIGQGGKLEDLRFTGDWIGTEVTTFEAGFTKQCLADPVDNVQDCIEFRFRDCANTGACLLSRQEACVTAPATGICSEQVVHLYNGTFSGNTYTGELIGVVVNGNPTLGFDPGCKVQLTLDEKTINDPGDDALEGVMAGGRLSDDCGSSAVVSSSYSFRRR